MPNEVEQLKERVEMLENIIYSFVLNGAFTFGKDIRMLDGKNFTFSASTGTKIGKSSTEKIGFWGATPVARQGGITAASGGATVDTEARATANGILAALQIEGILS